MNARNQFNQGAATMARIRLAYESLRKQMVEPNACTQWELGFAVLKCRGLAAWIDACWSYANPVVSGDAEREASETVVPAGVQGEVVMALAGMVLHTVSIGVTHGE